MSAISFEQAVGALVARVGGTIAADLASGRRGPDGRPTREAAQLVFARRLPELRATPEYKDALRSLTTDPAFAHVANSTVTSAVWSGSITGPDLLEGVLWRLIESGRLDSAEAEVRRLAAAAQAPLRARWMAPMFNLQLAIDPVPITGSLRFIRLSQSDLNRLDRMGALSAGPAFFRPVAGQLVGIESTHDTPRHLGGEQVPDAEALAFRRFADDAAPTASMVLQALRLFRDQRVWVPAIVLWTEDPLQGHEFVTSTFGFPSRPPTPIPMDYVLNVHDSHEFVTFYVACQDARGVSSSLDLALRRFSDASDRYRADDQLVDLMIAYEALFLGGSETIELSYRAALCGTAFTTDAPTERRDIFEHLRTAYMLRSKIVHGSTISKKDLKKAGVTELSDFVTRTESILRTALRKAILDAAATRSFEPDWDAMVLGLLDGPVPSGKP